MKTIRTTAGIKQIKETESGLIKGQVRAILQNQRTLLIDALLLGDLPVYVDYVFHKKLNLVQARLIRSRLIDLKETDLNMAHYEHVFESLLEKDVFQLDNIEIYEEINLVISKCFDQRELFVEQLFC